MEVLWHLISAGVGLLYHSLSSEIKRPVLRRALDSHVILARIFTALKEYSRIYTFRHATADS